MKVELHFRNREVTSDDHATITPVAIKMQWKDDKGADHARAFSVPPHVQHLTLEVDSGDDFAA